MNNKLWISLIVLQLLFIFVAFGQDDNKSKTSDITVNKTYIITKGETIFSLCKKFDCTQKELLSANPELVNGLKTGMVLNIPTEEDNRKVVKERKNKKNERISQHETQKDYKFHKVEEDETFFSYQKKYGVSQDQLTKINPDLKDGLKVGMVIKIPLKHDKTSDFKKHIVEKGETLYKISKLYEISIENIKDWNDFLVNRDLNAGDTLILGKSNDKTLESDFFAKNKRSITDSKNEKIKSENENNTSLDIKPGSDIFRVTLFLPFNLEMNDTLNKEVLSSKEFAHYDSISKIDKSYAYNFLKNKTERNLYGSTRNFLSFYEGFILALDSLANAGMEIRLDVYDCLSGQYVIDSVIRHTDLVNSDLIIGPIETKYQKTISSYCHKNQIPFISPLSSDDDHTVNNPFYFQVNPTKDYILRKTADFIGNEFYDDNFILLSLGGYEQVNEANIEKQISSRFASRKSSTGSFKEIDFTSGGQQGYWVIKENLKKDARNIVFIPAPKNRTEREAVLSRAINSLYTLSKDYDITLIGMSDYINLKSINTEYYHRLKLHFLTPNFIDYSDEDVKTFITKYRNKFSVEPNQYSFRGYDIATHFALSHNKFGRNFINNLSRYHPKTLQSFLDFKRVKDFSGFINKSLFIVNYTPDYEIKSISKIN